MPSDPVPNSIDPFLFPSETNARYLLLLVAIAGITLILADGVIGSILLRQGALPAFLAALGVTAGVYLRARQLARRDAQQRIKHHQWQPFPPAATGGKGRSLQAMHHYLSAVVAQIPDVSTTQPQFVWDEVNEGCDRPTGIAFGYGTDKYVCLRKGLHDAFLKARQSPQFNAVLLHELGHLKNRDVDKTILALKLGKSFFPVAVVLLGMLNLYVVWSTVERMVIQGSLQPVLDGLPIILGINVKTIVLIALVDILLSSVLRVREFYADARAREWLGQPNAFFEVFATEPDSARLAAPSLLRQRLTQGYAKLTRKHPTHKQRIAALLNPYELYRPSPEVALLSGLLAGLVLNSGVHFLGVGVVELNPLLLAINHFAEGLESSYVNLVLLRLILIGLDLLFWAVFLAIFALLLGLAVVPIVATVGLQLQAAAFSDSSRQPAAKPFVALPQLALLALMLGLGLVLGCLLVPVPKAFSLLGVSPLGLVGFVGLWAITFELWILPLVGLAKRVYGNHVGDQRPDRKRRFLTWLSAVALLPSVLTSSMAHVGFSVSAFDPEAIPVEGLGLILVSLLVMGFGLQGAVWLVGWGIANQRGWLRQPCCPHCQAHAASQLSPGAACSACGAALSDWMRSPSPITLPSLPAPEPVAATAPPL